MGYRAKVRWNSALRCAMRGHDYWTISYPTRIYLPNCLVCDAPQPILRGTYLPVHFHWNDDRCGDACRTRVPTLPA